jgi:hypothetical protein
VIGCVTDVGVALKIIGTIEIASGATEVLAEEGPSSSSVLRTGSIAASAPDRRLARCRSRADGKDKRHGASRRCSLVAHRDATNDGTDETNGSNAEQSHARNELGQRVR